MDNTMGSSAAPSLSPSLSVLYSNLSNDNRRLFIKVFKYLWGYVLNRRSQYDVVHLFWCVERLRIKYSLTSGELSLLTYLYQLSERGKYIIKSTQLFKSSSLHLSSRTLEPLLTKFKDQALIVRLSRDPTQPYLTRSIARQKIFIQFTAKGVAFVDTIEDDLRVLLINSTIDDVTTANNKGQTSA